MILPYYLLTMSLKTILFKCQYPRSLNRCLLLVKFCPVRAILHEKQNFLSLCVPNFVVLLFYFSHPSPFILHGFEIEAESQCPTFRVVLLSLSVRKC